MGACCSLVVAISIAPPSVHVQTPIRHIIHAYCCLVLPCFIVTKALALTDPLLWTLATTVATATAATAVRAAMTDAGKAGAAGGQHGEWGGGRHRGGLVEEAGRATSRMGEGDRPLTMTMKATVFREVEDLHDKPADEGADGGEDEVETTSEGEKEGSAKPPGVVGASTERERRKRGGVGFGDTRMTTMTM